MKIDYAVLEKVFGKTIVENTIESVKKKWNNDNFEDIFKNYIFSYLTNKANEYYAINRAIKYIPNTYDSAPVWISEDMTKNALVYTEELSDIYGTLAENIDAKRFDNTEVEIPYPIQLYCFSKIIQLFYPEYEIPLFDSI
jgi:hypothetical protein